MNPIDAANDLIIDDDDIAPSSSAAAKGADAAPWRVLVVDDDVDVHVVTKFALSNASFQGRRLSFLHAYSGKEALSILKETSDVALVLLDVIMETDDAGLRVAREIRSDLHNELARIVLRTGQPGQALEHSIIVDYDINDFWCKADLTTRKLFTTVISSLRAYASLVAAAHARDALNAELAKVQHVQATLNEHGLVLTLDPHGKVVDANEKLLKLAGVRRDQLIAHDLRAIHPAKFPEPLTGEIKLALAQTGTWTGDIQTALKSGAVISMRCTVIAFKDAMGQVTQYTAVATVVSTT
ncbi:MAG: PAS domain-containing protein [Pseudomonadota bacterium]